MEVVVIDELGETTAATVVIVLDTYAPPLCKGRLDDVTEGDVPIDNDDVGDAVTVMLLVAVFEKEAVGEELADTVPEPEEETVGVGEEEDVIDIVTLPV